MKTCTSCGETKPLDGYHKERLGKFGVRSKCIACLRDQRSAARAANVESIRERERAWHAANREQISERKRARYAAHREDLAAEQAAYRARNPHRTWEHHYRARALALGLEPVVESFTRDQLIARWGDACAHCGGPFEELDHYPVPVALGGPHTLENARPSCAPCNRSQGHLTAKGRAAQGITA